ncbi:conserved hypothetical protein [Verrucomicrobia bacterium]|nr:conserved hypothetical protein [Verrucomicrobiota bacterium]
MRKPAHFQPVAHARVLHLLRGLPASSEPRSVNRSSPASTPVSKSLWRHHEIGACGPPVAASAHAGASWSRRRRPALALAHWLFLPLGLFFCLPGPPLPAQTPAPRTPAPANRFLFIIETSRSMQPRIGAVFDEVQSLLSSGMRNQLHDGDSVAVWTYNQELFTGRLPLQQWSPGARTEITSRVLGFLRAQKFEKEGNLAKALPAMAGVIKNSAYITVILISAGQQKIEGTPYDARINQFYNTWQKDQQKVRMPFVTVLRAQAGRIDACTVAPAPWPVELPGLPEELKRAQALQSPSSGPPTQTSPSAVSSLIFSGTKSGPDHQAVNSPESARTVESAPAKPPLRAKPPSDSLPSPPASAPTSTPPEGGVQAPSDPQPTLRLGDAAQASPTTSTPPSSVPSQSPAPPPTTPPLPPDRPALPAPAASSPPAVAQPGPMPETKPADQAARNTAPAPSPTADVNQEPSHPATRAPSPVEARPPVTPASPSPVSSAVAVAPASTASHWGLWVAVTVFLGVALGFTWLWLRRSRNTAPVSLITESLDRQDQK